MMRTVVSRLIALVRGRRLDAALDDEVRTHLELLASEYERRGLSREDARRAARRAFGAAEPMKERYRDRRGLPWFDDLARDVRYGLRGMRRHPGLTATGVLTLALGIGANTALFTVIDAVLLKPLPVDDPDTLRLVTVRRSDPARPDFAFSQPVYADFRERVPAFSGVLQFDGANRMRMTLADGAGASTVIEPVSTQAVSGNFFSLLGVRPAAGRLLDEADDRDAAPVAVLSDAFWARRFGRDPSVVGRSIVVNDLAFTIVGVAARGFTGIEVGARPELWWPVQASPRLLRLPLELFNSRQFRSWRLVGRIRSGVDPAQAQAQAEAVFEIDRADLIQRRTAQFGGSLPAADRARLAEGRLRLESMGAGFTSLRWQFRRPLLVLMGVVALVLLIACANVANLLLARAASRTRELAVRLSLGSGRARLIRQLLVETSLLALVGGLVGTMVALFGSRLVATFLQSQDITLPVSPDLRVLAFTVVVSLIAAFMAGVVPAVTAARLDLVNRDARTGIGLARLTTHHVLVAVQVALSVVVLVVAGLFLRTLTNLRGLEIGVERDNLTIASLEMPPGAPPERRLTAYREILDRLNAQPGQRAAMSMFGMLSGAGWRNRILVPGDPPREGDDSLALGMVVSSGFFDVAGMRILSGRPFGRLDDAAPTRAAIVNETFARRFFGGNAVGGRFSMPDPQGPRSGEPFEIVGVVADAIYRNLRDEAHVPSPTAYFPALQPPGSTMAQQMDMQLQLRTEGPGAVEPAVRDLIRRVDPAILVTDVRTMRDVVDATIARERLLADLAGWLGLVSMTLGGIGIYGVRSYAVSRRTAEFGVRFALGASPRQVAGRVVTEGTAVAGIGIVVGLAAAMGLTRLVEGLLFGVTSLDVSTFAGAAAAFVMIAVLASYVPAWRATRIDPVAALRSE